MRTWIGVPFLHHGRTRSQGVDCLGLLICIYRDLGFEIAGDVNKFHYKPDWFIHTPEHVYLEGLLQKGVHITKAEALPGDIHYFKPGLLSRPKIDRVTHAGISLVGKWVGPDPFIHALSGDTRGVMVSDMNARAWSLSYAGTVRLTMVNEALKETSVTSEITIAP